MINAVAIFDIFELKIFFIYLIEGMKVYSCFLDSFQFSGIHKNYLIFKLYNFNSLILKNKFLFQNNYINYLFFKTLKL